MLARLASLDGVLAAEVDHHGELLRLRIAEPAALDRAHATLSELGYRADAVAVPTAPDARWYGPARVGELSRQEAEVIARRVVPPFARELGLSTEKQERLRVAVAGALHACFTAHTLGVGTRPDALRAACSEEVRASAIALVGQSSADRLVAQLWRDLDASAQPRGQPTGQIEP